MPGKARAAAAALAAAASRSRPGAGMIWMVTSRATSDCHSLAALATNITAPVVSDARNVMMATTAISARPEIELRGTSGVSKRGRRPRGVGVISRCLISVMSVTLTSIIDVQTPLMQHQPARIVLVHQRDVVGGDHYRGSGFVEFDEQPQQPLRQAGIDVAGRLVGEQQLRPRSEERRVGKECRSRWS